MNVKDIRDLLATTEPGIDGNIELIGVSFEADEESIFGTPNQEYIDNEIAWYMSKSRYIKDIPGNIPAIWKQIASSEGKINSNYGWCVFSEENHSQFMRCLAELRRDPNSRRAMLIYTRPTMHTDSVVRNMQDFMCTNTVQVLVRDNKVHLVVQMRSNDAVFGYKNDYAWQRYVQNMLSDILELPAGKIFWQVGSLHVYPRHFHLVEDYANRS